MTSRSSQVMKPSGLESLESEMSENLKLMRDASPEMRDLVDGVIRCIGENAGEVDSAIGEQFLELGMAFLEEHDPGLARSVAELDGGPEAVASLYSVAAIQLAAASSTAADASETLS